MTRVAPGRAAELQQELRDLLCLAVVGDHVRWVLVDDDGALAEWLAKAVPEWRALADEVAKRLVALGVAPDGRVRSLAEDIPLNWPDGWLRRDEAVRLLADRLHIVASWARRRRSQATDPDTLSFFTSSRLVWSTHDDGRRKPGAVRRRAFVGRPLRRRPARAQDPRPRLVGLRPWRAWRAPVEAIRAQGGRLRRRPVERERPPCLS